jgi:saposin
MSILHVFAVILCVTVIYDGSLGQETNQKVCHLGPLYYCQNMNNSLQCDSFNECVAKWKTTNSHLLVTDSFYCNFCTILMTDLQNILRSTIVQEEAIDVVNRLCNEISHDSLKSTCNLLVKMYLKSALDMLAKGIEPRVVCHAVQFCPGSAYIPQNVSSILHFHFQNQRRVKASSLERANLFLTLADPTECADCKAFISDVKARLVNNVTEQQLEAIFDEAVCSALPPTIQHLCRDVVHIYVQQLIMMLDQQLDSQEMCTLLGFCDADKLTILKKGVFYLQKHFSGQGVLSGAELPRCAYCKGIVSRARMLVADPKAQQKIGDMIKSELCPHLSTAAPKCHILIDLYLPILMNLLSSEMDPMVICETVHMCPENDSRPNKLPSLFLVKQPSLNGFGPMRNEIIGELSTCQLCDILLQAAHKRNLRHSTKSSLSTTLQEICSVFSESVAQRCHQLVHHYHKHLIRTLLHANADSKLVCPLAECHSSQKSSDDLLFKPQIRAQTTASPNNKNSIVCDLCKEAIVAAENYLKLNHTEEEVVEYLQSWCQDVPQQYQNRCIQLVKTYIPFIIDELVIEADPQTLCVDLSLCGTQSHHKLLGRRPCTWGPSYWCDSLLKAHRCNAVDHCQKNVWLAKKPKQKKKSS